MQNPTSELSLRFQFRWPVEQTGEKTIRVIVPRGDGPPILDKRFIDAHKLSDDDIDSAEDAVIREIAIIK